MFRSRDVSSTSHHKNFRKPVHGRKDKRVFSGTAGSGRVENSRTNSSRGGRRL